MLCPTSRPLIPAQILIVFVWYIPSSVIYSKQTQLSSIFSPSTHEKGGMTSTCVIPVQTQAKGRTMKKGYSSLYRQGRSSMSSANPSRIVPKIVVNIAMCMLKLSGVDESLRISVTTIPIMVKATAAAKPTHSGIYFSPSLLPFLLISRPKILFLCMNWETLGMRAPVNIHAHTPESRIRPAINRGICVSAAKEELTASVVVSEN